MGASLLLNHLHVSFAELYGLQNSAKGRLSGSNDPGRGAGCDRHEQ